MEDLLGYQEKYVLPLTEFILKQAGFVGIGLKGPQESGKTFILQSLAEHLNKINNISSVYLDLELLAGKGNEAIAHYQKIIKNELKKSKVVSKEIVKYFYEEGKPSSAKTQRQIIILDHMGALASGEQESVKDSIKILRRVPSLVFIADGMSDFLPLTVNISYLNETESAQFWAGPITPPSLVGDFPIIDFNKKLTPGSLLNFFSQYNLNYELMKVRLGNDFSEPLLKKAAFLKYQWPEIFQKTSRALAREPNLLLELEKYFALSEIERQARHISSPLLTDLSKDIYLERLLKPEPHFSNLATISNYLALFREEAEVWATKKTEETSSDFWSILMSGDRFRLQEIISPFKELDLEKQEEYLHRLLDILIDVSLDEQIRAAAGLALAVVNPERSLPQLEYVLASTNNPKVRLWLVKTLGFMNLPRAKEILKNMLKEEQMQVVEAGIELFQENKPLTLALENDLRRQEASSVRLEALQGLSELPLSEIQGILQKVKEKDVDPSVRARASDILRGKENFDRSR